jgi:P27 family predicted phage terminase small subunit
MGRRGPAPKPLALRLLQGNPGKLRLNPEEPKPAQAPPDLPCPEWLSPRAKEIWTDVLPRAVAIGLTVLDVYALAAFCQSFARWQEAEEYVDANGPTFIVREPRKRGEKVGAIKRIVKRPEVTIAKEQSLIMKGWAAELGFTPASRTRIHVKTPEPIDPVAKRIFGS